MPALGRAAGGAAAMVLVGLAVASAMPPGADAQSPCRNVAIRSPVTGEVVSGTVPILGSAQIDGFQFYKVEWAPADQPDVWGAVSEVRREAVINGLLDQWNTAPIPDGAYRLKLTVVDQAAVEVCRALVEDVVVGALATPTQTGTATSTATTTAAPADTEAPEPASPTPGAEATVAATAALSATVTVTATLGAASPDAASVTVTGLMGRFGVGFCVVFMAAALIVLLFGRRGSR